jgi:hypothetical protein
MFNVYHNFDSFGVEGHKRFHDLIDEQFNLTVQHLLDQSNPEDRFSATIRHPALIKDLYIAPKPVSEFDKTSFLRVVALVCQSNTTFLADGSLQLTVVIYKKVTGAGRTKRVPQTEDDFDKSSKSLIKVTNTDSNCGFIAIYIGLVYHELLKGTIERKIRASKGPEDGTSGTSLSNEKGAYKKWKSFLKNKKHQQEGGEYFRNLCKIQNSDKLNSDNFEAAQS